MKLDLASSSAERHSRAWKGSLIRIAVVGFILLVLGLVLYRDFVFGAATLLYKDMGSDSINIFYPYFVHLSDYLRDEGFPSWSFCVGMGQDISYFAGYLIWQPLVWLPRELIVHAIIYQHLLKLVLAGLLFFRFLQLHGLKFPASLLGSLCLSFSAYMTMGSCWYVNADEVVCFTFLLLAAEEAVGRGRWLLLVFAVALVGLVGTFHLYLGALLLICYVPARLWIRYSPGAFPVLRTSLLLAAAAFLGVGLAAVIVLPNFNALLNSPRGRGSVSFVGALSSLPVFGLQPPLYYITACFRMFGNNLFGVGSNFHGWRNFLEAPANYCGLFCLVISPQIFIGATRRRRIIYSLFLVGILVPIIFPWFRYLFWLFQGDYFRAFSLFSILGIITLSMAAFSGYIEGGRVSLVLLGLTVLGLLGVLCCPLGEFQEVVNPAQRRLCALLAVSYGVVLAGGRLLRQQKIAGAVIIVVTALELTYFGHMTVSGRPVVTKQELNSRTGYNDGTADVVRDIKAADDGFFRILKTWSSGLALPAGLTYFSLNDAMVFGFYSTTAYSSANNLNYINFLVAVDAIFGSASEEEMRWAKGLVGRPLLSVFAGEKYVLTKDPTPFQTADQYEFVKRYDDIYLFRNWLFLPFGLTYSHYITESAFLQLSTNEKAKALLHAVVLSSGSERERQGLAELHLDKLKQQMLESSVADTIALRRTNALQIHSFTQTRIEGAVHLDEKSILVLQTPFDQGWHAREDDRTVPVVKVDAGLLGVLLDGGDHKVKLRYQPFSFRVGAILSLLSILLLARSVWRWPRLRLPA